MLEDSLDAARVRQEELIASEAQQRIVASSRFKNLEALPRCRKFIPGYQQSATPSA